MLHEAPTQVDIVHLKPRLAKTDLDLQNTEDLRVGLEETKKETEALNSQLSAVNPKLSEMESPLKQKEAEKNVERVSYRVEKVATALRRLESKSQETEEELKALVDGRQTDESCNLEELEMSRSTFLAQAAIHKKETDQFMADRLQWEEEKASLLQERDSSVGQLNEQKMENQKLHIVLKKTEQELKIEVDLRQRIKIYLLEEIKKARSPFLAQMAIHKKETDQFMADRLQWEEEKASLLRVNRDSSVAPLNHQKEEPKLQEDLLAVEAELQETKVSFLGHLHQQKMENQTLHIVLKETEEERDSSVVEPLNLELQEDLLAVEAELQETLVSFVGHLQQQKMENQKLQNALEETKKTQVDQRQWVKIYHLEEMEKHSSTFLAQVAIHKKETDQFMADRLQWEEEKASLLQEIRDSSVARLNHQKEEVDHFAAALRNAEQQFEGFREWREEKLSLTRAVEELQQTLQKKEQELVSTEADLLAVKTQPEDLQTKVAEKKKNKWYRFPGLFTSRRAAANPLTSSACCWQ
ncbi:hypothetical protein VZT92_023284 [Zoarces viviparus]|uniref:Uncharacterized protein n=1 Tax=Zoarces viviparus TaxID=48416 RepID=A0AAW1E6Z8_ZOAVI